MQPRSHEDEHLEAQIFFVLLCLRGPGAVRADVLLKDVRRVEYGLFRQAPRRAPRTTDSETRAITRDAGRSSARCGATDAPAPSTRRRRPRGESRRPQ